MPTADLIFGWKIDRPDVVYIYDYDVRIIAIMHEWISKLFSFSHTDGCLSGIGFIAHHIIIQFRVMICQLPQIFVENLSANKANWTTRNHKIQ